MKRKGLLFWLSVFLMLSMIFSLGKHEIQASEGNPVAPVNIDMSIDNLFVGVGSKGFHPSSGNHLAIRTSVSCNTKQYFDGEIQLRLRILNKSGDYVYQKVYSNIGGKNIWGDSITSWENKTIYLNWNGKASKANTAGVKYGSFVPDGTYRVEVFYYAKDNSSKEYVKTITKKKSFKVSSKAPSGKDGVAAAATIPEYTGVDEIDYMAEKMITSAGIKTTMGQDEKVRRIYHWMTVNFKHKHADEFVKANIRVKTIRVEENNSIKENMSFSPFKFMELVNQDFENSELHKFFEETKLFFFIWKKDGDVYRVKSCQLWSMPSNDLEVVVRNEWEQYKNIIQYGVKFIKSVDRKGKISFKNNLPNKSDTQIIHIRPHSKMAAYQFNNGESYGNVERDANMLPNGEYMTTQSFWINNNYILKQLKDY